jgi:WD40 repeat protein
VLSVAFSPDGTLLAAATYARIFIWETRMGKVQIVLKSRGVIKSMAFAPSGTVLATGTMSGAILLRDVQSGVVLAQLDGHTGAVNTLSFSPDGKLLASGGAFTPDFKSDNTVRLWSVVTGEQLFVLEGHTDWVTDVAFNPAGTVLASVGGDTVRLWDVATGDELAVFEGYRNIAWSPDGTLLAAEGRNNTMRLWGVP